ncbi:MAG: cytochrome c5 family protein [Gammaproteobacteria bacterium]|nr:c-type cytochrome [Gammaproteobacteria bacterium]NNL99869.1 cytochrome c5 family protein [Gammaproteobacteria bacterium]
MDNKAQDAIFIRNFSLVLAGLAVIGFMAYVLAKIVNQGYEDSLNVDQEVAERIKPVGQVNVSGEALSMAAAEAPASAAAPAEAAGAAVADADPGEAVYNQICGSCHNLGIGGAPKFADAAAWEPRLAKGREALLANVINGYQGEAGYMPARGGLPTLTDEQLGHALDYMTAAAGGEGAGASTAETAAPAPEPAPVAQPEPEAAAEAAMAVAAAPDAGASLARGKEVYDTACFVCHTPGAAGAPKLGDAGAWGPRVTKGMDTLYEHAINGFMGEAGLMPPKGGRVDLSDDDVNAAVDYMVQNSQ